MVMQRLNGKWEHMKGMQEPACREALIGAFVDFFVDLCRVLNTSGHEPVAEVLSMRPSSRNRSQTVELTLLTQGRPR
ncbi:MAG: hypothetical protein HP496_18305 [Nitrospira sp.]|nr:hypothetical protein [Nitrospira sp.]